jgi:recombination protein RecT
MSEQALAVKALFNSDDVKKKFNELLGKRAPQFMTSVLQIVASNEMLKGADPVSVYQSAAVAATLDLPLNNNLGFAYIVPYNNKGKTVAQFQLGYKGFIQLAQRSGQFKTISASPIYDGQIIEANPLTGYKFDFTKRTSDVVCGYAAFFQLLNGFEKTLYMTVSELQAHGKEYSQTYKRGFGLWETDFDAMAIKTVLKLLLSRFAPLSVEMQRAVIADQAEIKDVDMVNVSYVDNKSLEDYKDEYLYLIQTYGQFVGDEKALKKLPTDDWTADRFASEIEILRDVIESEREALAGLDTPHTVADQKKAIQSAVAKDDFYNDNRKKG